MNEQAAAELPGTGAKPGPVPLRRNSGFRMLWIGQLLSDAGSQMGLIAYPLLILALTRSPVLAGVVGTARETFLICLQLPAGALSDRFDRRRTMIACDTVRAALLGSSASSSPYTSRPGLSSSSSASSREPRAASSTRPPPRCRRLWRRSSSWRRGPPLRAGPGPPTWQAPRSAGCCSAQAGPSCSSLMPLATADTAARLAVGERISGPAARRALTAITQAPALKDAWSPGTSPGRQLATWPATGSSCSTTPTAA
jgi:MFS family permease